MDTDLDTDLDVVTKIFFITCLQSIPLILRPESGTGMRTCCSTKLSTDRRSRCPPGNCRRVKQPPPSPRNQRTTNSVSCRWAGSWCVKLGYSIFDIVTEWVKRVLTVRNGCNHPGVTGQSSEFIVC